MSLICPNSELTKQAIAWVCEQMELAGDGYDLRNGIEEACVRFNLGPLDAEFLTRFFSKKDEQGTSI